VTSEDKLHLSVISIGEIRKGIYLLPQSRRREKLEQWFEEFVLPLVAARILPVTEAIADRWARLSAERQIEGAPLALADGLLAATALEHDLTVVTRNVRDFTGLGVAIINPWDM
jgi:predicted nucleic acid-binding protein